MFRMNSKYETDLGDVATTTIYIAPEHNDKANKMGGSRVKYTQDKCKFMFPRTRNPLLPL